MNTASKCTAPSESGREKSFLSISISSPVGAVYRHPSRVMMILYTSYCSLSSHFATVAAEPIEMTYSPEYPPASRAIFFFMERKGQAALRRYRCLPGAQKYGDDLRLRHFQKSAADEMRASLR